VNFGTFETGMFTLSEGMMFRSYVCLSRYLRLSLLPNPYEG